MGRVAVAERTLAQLKALDAGLWFHPAFAGERIPTVEEVFALLARYPMARVLVAVDLKTDDATLSVDVVGPARRFGVLDRLLFIGLAIGDADLRRRLRSAAPEAHVARLAETDGQFHAALVDEACDWVYVRAVPTEADVRRVHEVRKRVFIAGAKVSGHEPGNWDAAAGGGPDAILTDYLVLEGPTLVHALDAHAAHPGPFTANDLMPYRAAREPPCQAEARVRRATMRRARSKTKRPSLLAEVERRYRETPEF